MKNFFFGLCVVVFIFGIIAIWLFYLNYMLFPSKPAPPIKQEAMVERQELAQASAPAKKVKKNKKKQTVSRLVHPTRPVCKKVNRLIEEAASGYPWGKLQDRDVLLALTVTGLLSFASGVTYFQLGWKKRLPPDYR
jgi:hypothetical protein